MLAIFWIILFYLQVYFTRTDNKRQDSTISLPYVFPVRTALDSCRSFAIWINEMAVSWYPFLIIYAKSSPWTFPLGIWKTATFWCDLVKSAISLYDKVYFEYYIINKWHFINHPCSFFLFFLWRAKITAFFCSSVHKIIKK